MSFPLEIYKINAVVVILGVIGLRQRRPGEARLFHLVGIDRAPGIVKACFGHLLGSRVCHLERMATGLGSFFGPV